MIDVRKSRNNQILFFSADLTNINHKDYFVLNFLLLIIMESPAFFYTIFLWCLLLSITGYSIYVGFGPPSKELRDPFEDHED